MFNFIIEFVGTFMWILAYLIATKYPEYMIPVITGMVYISVMFIGVVTSGGHFNPVTSTAMLINGNMALEKYIYYIIAQMCGGIAAVMFYNYKIKGHH